ncbi:MAG: hypothetical protein QM692_06665 [Thermomicrobiales bacterium]
MRRTACALMVTAALLFLTGCGNTAQPVRNLAVSGSVLLLETEHFSQSGKTCSGRGTLASIREGAAVTIDKQPAATLSRGTMTAERNCRFLFTASVPQTEGLQRHAFSVAELPPVTGVINDRVRADWQAANADGWVTIGWD